MDRIKVLHESKFNRMTDSEMAKINGGLCISCKKRARRIEIGGGASGGGTCSSTSDYTVSGSGWIRINF